MPRIYEYQVRATTTQTNSRRSYLSAIQQILTPDDLAEAQILDSLDEQITSVWNACLVNSRPFQLGLCTEIDAQHLVVVTIAPQHLVSLQTTLLGWRDATEQEAQKLSPQLPEMNFIPDTEQPPADGEGLSSGSQPA